MDGIFKDATIFVLQTKDSTTILIQFKKKNQVFIRFKYFSIFLFSVVKYDAYN